MQPSILFLSTLTLEASIDTMIADLCAGCRAQGAFARAAFYTSTTPNTDYIVGLLNDLRQYDGPRYVVDVNGKTRLGGVTADGTQVSLFDAWNLPRLSFFESNPLHHLEHLAAAPKLAAYSVIEESHRKLLHLLGVPEPRVAFIPHAGPPPAEHVAAMADRTIDVLMVGNIGDARDTDNWLAELGLAREEERAVARQCFDQMWAEDGNAFELVCAAMVARGFPLDLQRESRLALAIEARTNALNRLYCLQGIRHTRVHVYGTIPPGLTLPDNCIVGGPVGFAKAMALMDSAKLLLNFMHFRTGAHERVFYGLSRGACSLTDRSHLLEDGATRSGGIIFRAPPEAVDQQVADLLANPTALDERVAAGRAWYATRHSWVQRAATLLEALARAFP